MKYPLENNDRLPCKTCPVVLKREKTSAYCWYLQTCRACVDKQQAEWSKPKEQTSATQSQSFFAPSKEVESWRAKYS